MSSIKRILYPTDFSAAAEKALAHALFIAARHGATLHALHMFEAPVVPILIDTGDYVERIREENFLLMRMLREKVHFAASSVPLTTKVEEDTQASAADHILAYADAHDIDLIVMGTHGRQSPGRLFMGSVAEEVTREATCAVYTVRNADASPQEAPLERILVPLDFSEHGRHALTQAREMAATFRAHLDVLHVIENMPMMRFYYPQLIPSDSGGGEPDSEPDLKARVRRKMVEMVEDLDEPAGDVQYHLGYGHVSSSIIDFAEAHGTGLIVMPSHGLTDLKRFLMGSVTERVMRTAPCPMLVVKRPARAEDTEEAPAVYEQEPELETV
jgi:nucleotide-binding universal stress UspA family protein